MFISSLRGDDAAGIAAVFNPKGENESPTWVYLKQPGQVKDLVYGNKHYDNIFNSHYDLRIVIGHTRFATIGKNSKENTHPFSMNNVVGAHNGTLRKLPEGHKRYETDSEALFARIDEAGEEEAINEIEGAYALTWFDRGNNKNTLNFLRNAERPLYIAALKNSESIMWASESEALEWILKRNNLDFECIIKLKQDTHVIFRPFNQDDWVSSPETKELKPTKTLPPTVVSNYKGSIIEKMFPKPKSELKTRKGFNGLLLSEKEYNDLLDCGCIYCGRIQEASKPLKWISSSEWLCEEHKDTQQLLTN